MEDNVAFATGEDAAARSRSESQTKAAISAAATRREEKLKTTEEVEYVEKRVCCRKKRVLKDPVPSFRVWKLQKPEAPFIALGIFATLLTGGLMPSFALLFSGVSAAVASLALLRVTFAVCDLPFALCLCPLPLPVLPILLRRAVQMISTFYNPSNDEMEEDSNIYLGLFLGLGVVAFTGWFLQTFSFTYLG